MGKAALRVIRSHHNLRLGRRAALLALCCIPCMGLAVVAAAMEVTVSRAIFGERPERQDEPSPPGRREETLPPGREVEMRAGRLLASDALRLRVESPDPELNLLLRFRPKDAKAGTLTLTVVLFSPQNRFDYQHQQQSSVMEGGRLEERKSLRLGEGLETDLGGAMGEVVEILIQDDGTRELRLALRGNVLLLRVIPFEEGGNPSGALLPYFERERLNFLDYSLLAGGYEQNAYGELVLFEDFAFMANFISDDADSVTLARGVIRQQLVRWRRAAISLEGGPAFFSLDPEQLTDEDDGELSLVLGATLDWRYGNWGARLHAASVDGASLAMFLAGWQFAQNWSVFLEWQSFKELSDSGLGLGWRF